MSAENPTNPFDRLPSDYQLPGFKDLSPGQRQAILDGPGWVNRPVTLRRYEDVGDFRYTPNQGGSNNFIAFFNRTETSSLAYAAAQTPAFQRFHILYPELVEHLDQAVATAGYGPPPTQTWGELLKAYNIMSQLVDANDPDVLQNGQVDDLYLWH
jgi:hypothetical protein